jgi:HD-GYP domain-containing protein (c-di-GMP phosphodiesterase class II)
MTSPKSDREFADELRELVREAHGAAKDLNRELKTSRALINDSAQLMKESVTKSLDETVTAFMTEFEKKVDENQLVDVPGMTEVMTSAAKLTMDQVGEMLLAVAEKAREYVDKKHGEMLEHMHFMITSQTAMLKHQQRQDRAIIRLCARLGAAAEADKALDQDGDES